MSAAQENTDLAALGSEIAAADAGVAVQLAAPPGAPEPVAHAVDRIGEAALILGVAKPLLVMLLPCLKDAPDAEWQPLQQPIAELLEHYKTDVGKWLGNPWAKLAVAATPLALRGVAAWNKQPPEETPPPEPEQGAPQPAPG